MKLDFCVATLSTLGATCLALFSLQARANASDALPNHAQSDRLAQRTINLSVAPIKSQSDLAAYEIATPKSQNPLNILSPANKNSFLHHLTFSEKGLASFNYDPLHGLNATQVYKILSLFGLQDDTSLVSGIKASSQTDKLIMAQPLLMDHQGYACISRATCSTDYSSICTSNC